MKKLTFLLVMFLMTGIAFSQSTASFQDAQLVIEGQDNAVRTTYKLDIAPLELANEKQAKLFFASINSNLEMYKLDYGNGVVYVTLFPEHTGNVKWNLEQWNQYFFERSDIYRKALETAKAH